MNEGSQHTQQELEQVTHKEQFGNLFMDYFNGREFIHIWWVFYCKRTLFFTTSHCNWILVNISYHFTISVMTSDLYIKITALHVTLSHMYTWHTVHRAKVEGRFTDDLNHFASLIYTVYNPKRLAEMLNARLGRNLHVWDYSSLTGTMASSVLHFLPIRHTVDGLLLSE